MDKPILIGRPRLAVTELQERNGKEHNNNHHHHNHNNINIKNKNYYYYCD